MRQVPPLLAAALLCAAPTLASAQEARLPFSGRWGAQLSIDQLSRRVGVLRFSSPNTALLVEGGVGFGRHTGEFVFEDPFGSFRADLDVDSWDLELRGGLRRYRALSPRVARFWTLGATGGTFSEEATFTEAGGEAVQETSAWFIGPFAQLGASYYPVPGLGVGIATDLTAVYSSSELAQTTPADGRQSQDLSGWELRIGLAAIVTMHF